MIKNIYDKDNKQYRHNYYCDNCLLCIDYGKIYRNEFAIHVEKFDLCYKCWKNFNKLNEGIDLLVKEDKK